MEIQEIRKINLLWVLHNKFGGNKSALAYKMDIAPNNISRFLGRNPEHRRNITDHTARSIEEAARLPRGWMDARHDNELENRAKEALMNLLPEELELLEKYAQFLIWQRGQ